MMAKFTILAAIFLAASVVASPMRREKRSVYSWFNPPDTAQMIVANGYPVEKHDIVTEDGYILGVFRIPYGKGQRPYENRPPVILQHGIMASSDSWVLSIPEKGLAYVLADNGFDVWIGNNRGIIYSQRHTTLSIKDKAYWDFSFHEMGVYDVPAMIDYIHNMTGQNVSYVGHSQGTSQFLAMTSVRPEYNKKVKVASLLAPVAFLDGTEGLVKLLTRFAKSITFVAKIFGINHVLEHNFVISAADKLLCRPNSWMSFFCDDLLEIIAGFDSAQQNKTLVEIIAQYSPTGASIKQLEHFMQLTQNGNKFTMYDYGNDNMNHYGQSTPKEYNLSTIDCPIMLHYSKNDYIARPQNVQRLGTILKNNEMIEVVDPNFNHLDFMWAIDVVPLLYNDVIAHLKKYQ